MIRTLGRATDNEPKLSGRLQSERSKIDFRNRPGPQDLGA